MKKEQIELFIRNKVVVDCTAISDKRLRVRILRQSKKTSGLTVEIAETQEIWKVGEHLHVAPYQVEEKQLRHDELQSQLTRAYLRTIEELTRTVNDGKAARIEFARKITEDINDASKADRCELLADQVRWGHGVKQDLKARHAARILAVAEKGESDLKDILTWMAEDLEGCLLRNQFLSHSTSQFSNAIDETRAEVAREFAEWCRNRISWMAEYRADMEVL